MSDYIFSSIQQPEGKLTKTIESIYENSLPKIKELHGDWGSLAVSNSQYSGFKPYETELHILIVIGGPVLYFRDNDFLVEADSADATKAIYQRWLVEKKIQWDQDLNGPFTILLISKLTSEIQVITDLMCFIPAYICEKDSCFFIGTHIDALALSCGECDNYDDTSLADFLINDVITYPYTAYTNIRQFAPGCMITLESNHEIKEESYWLPVEQINYDSLRDAAAELRYGIQEYVNRVTSKMNQVAQFISGGEDSRVLSGILPKSLKRDGYTFLDNMNREGIIAKKVADIYGVNITVGYRTKTHYLDILSEASKLVGTGHQYHHAHSLGFNRKYHLSEYPAVFGGYLSDSLLKSAYALNYKKTNRYPFMPNIFKAGETRTKEITSSIINNDILKKINERRTERFKALKILRPVSAHEWFVLYPATMRTAIPNLYTTRRLFRSYEPFMCNEAVKISSAVPTKWKINRQLFNCTMKPFLKKSKWLFHEDGRLPFFSWWINTPIHFICWFYFSTAKKLGFIKKNQGSWADWSGIFKDERWFSLVTKYQGSDNIYRLIKKDVKIEDVLCNNSITSSEKRNLIQILFKLK